MKNFQLLKEEKSHGDDYLQLAVYPAIIQGDQDKLYLHWHQEMEISYINSGEGFFQINSEQLYVKKGDLVFVKSGLLHAAKTMENQTLEWTTVVFNLDLLQGKSVDRCQLDYIQPLLNGSIDLVGKIQSDMAGYDELNLALQTIFKTYYDKPLAYELELKALLLQMIMVLYRKKYISRNNQTPENERLKRLKKVLTYVQDHYQSKITIEQLANIANYSTYHFIRLFKQEIGMTAIEYVHRIRLKEAENLLLNTKLPITEIALQVGFENVSYFIRKFKAHYGQPPAKYRREAE